MQDTSNGRADRDLTEVEAVRVAHLVADHAASFYGQFGTLRFGVDDAVRYTVEGYVGKVIAGVAWQRLFDAVAGELAVHPEILTDGPLSTTALADRKEAREAAAQVHDDLAGEAFKVGDYALAVAHVDAAELQSPDAPGFRSWSTLRELVSRKFAEAEQAEAAGRAAYVAGAARAPGVDATVLALIGDVPVGTPRTQHVMDAFLRGFDQAADEAAAAALA